MPIISIIIPVYNAEKYLRKCLDSVVNQTITDIEVICVDDCSTDGSLDILREYEQKDSRVRVVHCERNNRQAAARNIGMNLAVGKYLAFVDNDDWIDCDRFENLCKIAEKENSDITLAGHTEDNEDGFVKYYHNLADQLLLLDGVSFVKGLIAKTIRAWEVWNGLFRASLIKNANLQFQTMRAEDYVFSLEAGALANKVCLTPYCSYHYLHRGDSDKWGKSENSLYNLKGIEICIAYLRQDTILKRVITNYNTFIDKEIMFSFCGTILCESSIMTHNSFLHRCKAVNKLLLHPLLIEAYSDKRALRELPAKYSFIMRLLKNAILVPFVVLGLSIREFIKGKYYSLRGWKS